MMSMALFSDIAISVLTQFWVYRRRVMRRVRVWFQGKGRHNELGCEVHVLQFIDTAQGADLGVNLDTPRL